MFQNQQKIQSQETHLNIWVNYFCNQKCVFCTDGDKSVFNFIRTQTSEEYYRQIRELREKYDEIMFTNGEPTLNKELFEYARYAQECGYKKISLITNGSTLIHERVRAGIVRYMNHIIVSIHGSNALLHDRITGVPGIFERTLKGLVWLRKEAANLPIDISFVLNRMNLMDMFSHWYLFIEKIGVHAVLVNTMRPDGYGGDRYGELTIRYSDFVSYMHRLSDEQRSYVANWIENGKLVITDVPFCIVKDAFEGLAGANPFNVYGKMEAIERNSKEGVVIYDKNRNNKRFLEKCTTCRHYRECEGVYIKYVELFGEDEIHPITV